MGETPPKVGLFLCRCGNNVAGFMDMDDIAAWAKENPDIAFVEFNDLLCSPAGKTFAQENMEKTGVDYYIVAGCSPKMHEKTFQEVAQKAGKNIANVQLANIREQCGWVTKDKELATAKAKNIIRAAIERIKYHENLEQESMEVLTDIVVIGGGLAGIEAAIMAGNAGRNVTIIDKEVSLGGQVILTEEVSPHMECAPCLLAPRLSEIRDHKKINVVTNAEVNDVLGFFGNYTVKVTKKARYITDACIGCEECFEPCPVSMKSEFHLGLGERKAVYTQFPGSVPAAAVIDAGGCKKLNGEECDACVKACPFGAVNFDDKDEDLEIQCGGVIVATGSGQVAPEVLEPLGYGKIDNVYTMGEFERLASSNGPNAGTIQLKNGEAPESIAVIHCAGSLCEGGLDYCSGTCCAMADKAGELMHKQSHSAKVYNIHDRLVYNGPEAQAFHANQLKEGTQYLKTDDLSSVKVEAKDGKIQVRAAGVEPIVVDLVVLSTGQAPTPGMEKLAEMLNVERDKAGFFKADHPTLHATGSTLDGINLAGPCQSPCDADTAVTRAHAAAGDLVGKLQPGKKIELEVMTTIINEEVCAGCKLCISVCPYKAISFNPEKCISEVNEAICRGCGTCASNCASNAMKAKHFTDQQMYAEIGGILND